jgi:hypothetical protein
MRRTSSSRCRCCSHETLIAAWCRQTSTKKLGTRQSLREPRKSRKRNRSPLSTPNRRKCRATLQHQRRLSPERRRRKSKRIRPGDRRKRVKTGSRRVGVLLQRDDDHLVRTNCTNNSVYRPAYCRFRLPALRLPFFVGGCTEYCHLDTHLGSVFPRSVGLFTLWYATFTAMARSTITQSTIHTMLYMLCPSPFSIFLVFISSVKTTLYSEAFYHQNVSTTAPH